MVDWGAGLHTLTVILDTSDMEQALGRTRLQLGLAQAGVLAIIGLGVLVVLARLRHRQLRTELVVAKERAAYHEKLSRLGAGLAHETRNPLGVVRGLAQSIEQSEKAGAEAKRMASSIVDEADRTVGQINSFLSLARPKEPVLAPVELVSFFEGFLPLLQAEAKDAGVAVTYHGSGETILADEDLLRRLLLNLTINAVKACGGHGEVLIEAKDGVLSVRDNGCGIAPEDLEFVKDPYFGRFEDGTGLGLSIVDQIARGHGWRLAIESEPGVGTRVSLDGIHRVP
jgi:signal transduction histidine kinase